VLPLLSWLAAHALGMPVAYLLRFFAGFCLIANGAYLGAGMFVPVGDAADLLRSGSSMWPLALFGLIAIPTGLAVWHRQGAQFGLGAQPRPVNRRHVIGCAIVLAVIIAIELVM
jgi:hypothetical protein